MIVALPTTTNSLAKGIKPESDPVSGSNCQFAGQAGAEELVWMHYECVVVKTQAQWNSIGQTGCPSSSIDKL